MNIETKLIRKQISDWNIFWVTIKIRIYTWIKSKEISWNFHFLFHFRQCYRFEWLRFSIILEEMIKFIVLHLKTLLICWCGKVLSRTKKIYENTLFGHLARIFGSKYFPQPSLYIFIKSSLIWHKATNVEHWIRIKLNDVVIVYETKLVKTTTQRRTTLILFIYHYLELSWTTSFYEPLAPKRMLSRLLLFLTVILSTYSHKFRLLQQPPSVTL